MPEVYHRLDASNIPRTIRGLDRWLIWRLEMTPGGRPTKRPTVSTRTGPWQRFDTAIELIDPEANPGEHGVGFVFTDGVEATVGGADQVEVFETPEPEQTGRLIALDLDGCRNPESGELAPWASEIVGQFQSYTEVSPSGSGLRIFAVVDAPVPAVRVIRVPEPTLGGYHRGCEVQLFGAGPAGYVTVTGWRLDQVPAEPVMANDGLRWLLARYPEATAVPESGEHPVEIGRAPTADDIQRRLAGVLNARETALAQSGDWETFGLPSASEGWFVLVRKALTVCAGHLGPVVDWLLGCTAYGRGDIESKDPGRYQSREWVEADVARVWSKRRADARAVFGELPVLGTRAAGDDQASPYEHELRPVEPFVAPDRPYAARVEGGTPVLVRDADSLFGEPGAPPAAAAPEAGVSGPAPAAAAEGAPEPPQGEAPPSGFFVPVGELRHRDLAPRWLVDGLLEENTVAVLSGSPGSFKSFLVLDVALALATGHDWHGRGVKPCPVLMLAGEGHGGLARRINAWCQSYGRGDEVDQAPFVISRHAAAILDDAAFGKLETDSLDVARTWGRAPGLVVIDTLNRNFGPGDENSADDVTQFLARVDRFRQRFGCAVLVVHHVGHGVQTRSRGSSVIGATVDAEIMMNRNRAKGSDAPLPGARVVFRKMKDAEEPLPFHVATEVVELGTDEKGKPITSLVIDRLAKNPPPPPGSELADDEVQKALTAVLRAYESDGLASREAIAQATGLSVRMVRKVRDLAERYELAEVQGEKRWQKVVLTLAGRERLAASDEPTPVQVNPDAGDEIADLLA